MADLNSTIVRGNLRVTGDVRGSLNASDITYGTLAKERLATSNVTAGSYGPSENAAPAFSGTFNVPYITVDSYGRVTAASTKTVTVPSAAATTSAAGLMSATDKTRLDGIWTSFVDNDDDDTVVNRLRDILNLFTDWTEGNNVLGYLSDNYAAKSHTHSYLPLSGGVMTGPIKWAGATQELISTAYSDGTWKGGIKYSWSSNTTIAIWGKHKMSQFAWNAGTDFSSTDVNGTSTKTYDFQVGRDASDGAAIGRIGGNIILHAGNYTTYCATPSAVAAKLDKTSYEYNNEISFGSSGYLKIGSFPMYDSNITIDIDSTTSTTYHGTVVIATQNVSNSSMGSAHVVKVYGDATNTITPSIRVTWASGSRNYNVYFVPPAWSKNLVHVRAMALNAAPSDICTSQTGDAPTSTSGLEAVNALTSNFVTTVNGNSGAITNIATINDIPTNTNQLTNGAGYITGIDSSMVTTALGYTPVNSSSSASENGTTLSLVTTGEKYAWNSKATGSITDDTGSEAVTIGSKTLNVVTRDTAQTISGSKRFSNSSGIDINSTANAHTYLKGSNTSTSSAVTITLPATTGKVVVDAMFNYDSTTGTLTITTS